ncbi:MAG: extracellular solute-binding protein [Treponema sp.]|jgi:putative aldouronate transport system substrate-binding protein|nr:extracellular solute-binding protein [Treponema sp.]
MSKTKAIGRTVSAAVCILAALFMAAACQKPEQAAGERANRALNPDEPAWKSDTGNTTKLRWYINLGWVKEKWGDDWTSAYVKETTGFDFEIIGGGDGDKLNTMIASGDLPDIITMAWWESQFNELAGAGLLLPLNKLAEQYDPYFFKVANPDILNWNRKDDGNVYGYNCYTITPSAMAESDEVYANHTFLVRKDMYEALGRPDMTTPEGFLQALRDAKAYMPRENGVPVYPFGLGDGFGGDHLDAYLQDFLAIPYEQNGRYYDRSTDPEYIRWLKTLRQAYSEGLISNDIFTDRGEQVGDKLVQGRYFASLKVWVDMQDQQRLIHTTDPSRIYIAVDGPRNSRGDPPTLPGGSIDGWLTTGITSKCKDPSRAIEFFTYMLSEEGLRTIYMGVPGKTYDMVNGKAEFRKDYWDSYMANPDVVYYESGVPNLWGYFLDDITAAKYAPESPDYIRAIRDWTAPYVFYGGVYSFSELDPDSRAGINSVRIKNLWLSSLPKFVTASSDREFDTLFAEFTAKRAEYGWDEIMEIYSGQIAANKKKLGM